VKRRHDWAGAGAFCVLVLLLAACVYGFLLAFG
jgi:hypothetical protein